MARRKQQSEPEPPKRRTYGTGTVTQRSDGSWQAQLPRGVDPKRRATYHATKADAEAWLADQLDRYARGLGVQAGLQAFGQRVDDFLDARTWEENTEKAYRGRRKHLVVIDDVLMEDLRKSHVELVVSTMRKKRNRYGEPLSARYIRQVLSLLWSVLDDAVRNRVIISNPVDEIRLPKLPQMQTVVLSETEARKLLRSTEGTRWHAAWWILLSVGLRSGELRALSWDDVDLDGGRLRIWRSTPKPTQIGQTKGRRERWVPLPAPCIEALRQHRELVRAGAGIHPNARRKGAPSVAGSKWIFPSHVTGRPFPSHTIWKHLHDDLEAAGLPPIRVHDLRHSAATFMLARRRPLPVVAEILGHQSSAFTSSRYGHVLSGQYREVADTMAEVLSEPATPAKKRRRRGESEGKTG